MDTSCHSLTYSGQHCIVHDIVAHTDYRLVVADGIESFFVQQHVCRRWSSSKIESVIEG